MSNPKTGYRRPPAAYVARRLTQPRRFIQGTAGPRQVGTSTLVAQVVGGSRRIAVELYRELVALRPAWHGESDDAGALKVVMTDASATPRTRFAS